MDEENVDVLDVMAFNSQNLIKELESLEQENNQIKAIESYLREVSEKKVELPIDFQKDLDWFNVRTPLTMAKLKGKIVILDFFTYCCINCMHSIADLKALQKCFPIESGLVVVGVHSAKFDNEKNSSNLLSAIQRYEITYPVVNDIGSNMWAQLNIKCWPTLLILSPNNYPICLLMGEGHGDFLKKFLATATSFYNDRHELDSSPIPLNRSNNSTCASKLRFPGKICSFLSEKKGELIAVSDSGNNRILVLNSDGDVLEKIGGFDVGFIDGDFNEAKFASPQGVTFFNEDILIVADTENHSIRKINFKERRVSTIAGTGKQGNDKIGGSIGTNQHISSPWDIVVFRTRDMDMSFHIDEKTIQEKHVILIAMAGTHQIWGLFLDGMIWWKFKKYEPSTCAALIGNGCEENRNNSYPQNAGFAQPSGLTIHKEFLIIADSESSSIRKVSMIDGKVTTIVGGDRNPLNLFSFGDKDGKQFSAKLQHPLGVSHNNCDGYLYVADTYNHKVKRVNIASNEIETCLIQEENSEHLFQFGEPGGLCVSSSGKYLYIANTNHHKIMIVDLKSLRTWPLALKFKTPAEPKLTNDKIPTLEKVVKINKGSYLVIESSLIFKYGLKLTENAPQQWSLLLPTKGYKADHLSGVITEEKFTIRVKVDVNAAMDNPLVLNCHLNLCNVGTCIRKEFSTRIKLIHDEKSHLKIKEKLIFAINNESVHLL